MRYPPTIEAVENVLKILGYEWRGEWQREAAKALCEYPEVVIQGSRQVFGKDFSVGIFEAARVISGNTVTIGFPTLTQGARLLGERVINEVNRFGMIMEDATGSKFWKKSREQTTYQRWSLAEDLTHEGKLYVLSANEISRTPPEGYTTDDLDFNEAHRNTEKILGIFEPFNLIARQQHNSKTVYMGVGGHKSSLIEIKKTQPHVKVVRWTASQIGEAAPEWRETIEHYRRSLPPWQWRQHFECEQSAEGMQLMYPEEFYDIDFISYIERNIRGHYYIGIDVGRLRDATVVCVILRYGDKAKVVDYKEIPRVSFLEQAAMIFEYVNKNFYWKAERIGIELNGMGHGLYDVLNQPQYFYGLVGITTDETLKEDIWGKSVVAIREGNLTVTDPRLLEIFQALTYECKVKDGKFELEHSDEWMSFVMAYTLMQEPGKL